MASLPPFSIGIKVFLPHSSSLSATGKRPISTFQPAFPSFLRWTVKSSEGGRGGISVPSRSRPPSSKDCLASQKKIATREPFCAGGKTQKASGRASDRASEGACVRNVDFTQRSQERPNFPSSLLFSRSLHLPLQLKRDSHERPSVLAFTFISKRFCSKAE